MPHPPSIRTHHSIGELRPSRTTTWRAAAACRTADPELFFPLPGVGSAAALEHCGACPVRGECLDEALRNGHGGIRGGLTEDARRRLRAQRRAS